MLRLTLIVVLLIPAQAFAGAWTLDRRETNAFVTTEFSYGDHGFDGDGKLVQVPDYQKFTLRATVEYGVRGWLTGIGKAELRTETRSETHTIPTVLFQPPVRVTIEEQKTFGSVAGGARVRFHEAPNWVLSGESLVSSGGFDSTGIIDQHDSPSLEGRLLFGIGQTIADRPVFADVQAGYRAYLDRDVSDEVKLDVTLGAKVLPNWLIMAQSFTTYDTDGESHDTKLVGSVVRDINERLSVQFAGGGTVHGKNAIREYTGKVSFWWSF